MKTGSRPAVERVQPPKAPYRVVNRIMRWLRRRRALSPPTVRTAAWQSTSVTVDRTGTTDRRTDPRVLRSRAAVLRATLELLGERGIGGTTIESVAERSGVAKTTIYRQWDSQAALVLDAFSSIQRPPSDPGTGSLRGDLVDLLTGFAEALATGPATGLMFALIDAAERDTAFAALHRREAESRHAVIRRVITRGIERGELPAGTDPAEVLDLLAGPVFHRRAVSAEPLEPAFAERVVDRILAAYGTVSVTA